MNSLRRTEYFPVISRVAPFWEAGDWGWNTGAPVKYGISGNPRSRSRSKVTWYGHFCDFTKIASSRRQMAGSLPTKLAHNGSQPGLHPGCARGQGRGQLGHMIRALTWFHKNRFFSQANGCILTKLSLSLTSPTLCPFGFLPHSNPQMAVSLRCEFRHSSHG